MKQYNFYVCILTLLLFLMNGCGQSPQKVLPKIAGHNCIDLDKITTLSVYWIKDGEQEKPKLALEYIPFDEYKSASTIEVYIPVDGEIQSIVPADESNQLKDVTLTFLAKEDSNITIELHNIDLNSEEWGEGATVKAGMHIGYTVAEKPFSICVLHSDENATTSHNFLHITADYVFQHYQDRGFQNRDQFETMNPAFFNAEAPSGSIELYLK